LSKVTNHGQGPRGERKIVSREAFEECGAKGKTDHASEKRQGAILCIT